MTLKRTISNRKGGKLFLSVLITYLLLLVVTISVLVSGFYSFFHQSQQEMESLQITYLEQIRRELDLRLNAIFKINNFLASYPLTRSVSELDNEQAENQILYRSLNEVISEQNALINSDGETAIYFETSDSILTGESRYRSENLDAYTEQLGFTPEEFRQFIAPINSRGSLRSVRSNQEDGELIYLFPIYDTDLYRRVGTVITRLSIAYLNEIINTDNWIDGSICHMENSEEYFYIVNGGFGETLAEKDRPDYSHVTLNATPVKTEINSKSYITVGLQSSINTWKYYFSIPAKEFYRSNVLYFVWFTVTIGMSLFSGSILSMVFSHRFSRPIHNMLDSLRLDTSVAYPKAITALEKAVDSYRKELSSTRNQISESTRRKRGEFLYKLCTEGSSSAKFKEACTEYRISLDDAPVMLIQFLYVDLEHSVFAQEGMVDIDLLIYASCNVLEEMLCPERGATFSHNIGSFCIYQPSSLDETDLLRDKLEKVRQFHQEILHVSLQIFVAGSAPSLFGLPDLMSRAEEMFHYKAFWGDDAPDLLFYQEISELSDLKGSYHSLGMEKRFSNLLAIKDYEGAHKILMELLQSGFSKDVKRFPVERFKLLGLLSNLLEAVLSEISVSADEMEALITSLRDLIYERSFHGLKEKVDHLFRYLLEHQEREWQSDAPSWVWNVRQYIEQHYSDPQLDVSLLAKEFNLNVSHLSRTYKKMTSIGVLDNIHLIRISHAKELLNQGFSVQQTSIQVGYLESRALIRTFKRYEGITPGQYQEVNKR